MTRRAEYNAHILLEGEQIDKDRNAAIDAAHTAFEEVRAVALAEFEAATAQVVQPAAAIRDATILNAETTLYAAVTAANATHATARQAWGDKYDPSDTGGIDRSIFAASGGHPSERRV